MKDNIRVSKYLKDLELDRVLEDVNSTLLASYDFCDNNVLNSPVTFIVGVQRSGSTFLNQLLINNFHFTYPNNLVARFWDTPFVGVALSKSLKLSGEVPFVSDLGYTEGINSPHEFGYFWKKWFDPIEQKLSSDQLSLESLPKP